MAIILSGSGNPVDYIEIKADKVPYSFRVKLEDKTYNFIVRYNNSGNFFTIDLETLDGKTLCYGDIVRYGRPLFGPIEDERFPLPVIIPRCLSDDNITEVTKENFGSTVKLYLHKRRVDV